MRWFVHNNAVELRPALRNVLHANAVGKTVLRHEQHAFGRSTHNPVIKGYQAVGVALLVYNVSHERVYLAVYERVCLEHVWVASVFKWRFALFQDVAERGEVIEVPVIIHKPCGFYQGNFIFRHTGFLGHLHTLAVYIGHLFLVVRHFYLEYVTVLVVMATVTGFLFLSPHFDYPAPSRLAGQQEVVVFQAAVTETLGIAGNVFPACRPLVYLLQPSVFLRSVGELFAQLAETHVMYFSEASNVPASEVAHIVVDKEIVGLHIVSPAILLVVSPSVTLAVYDEAAYQELFH